MEKVNYPSVCVVDTHATRPPVPPRLNQVQRKSSVAQILLFMLVSLALCGMVIEACFIYRLYHHEATASASSSKQTGDDDVAAPTKQPSYGIPPSKPVAHLTDGQDVTHDKQLGKMAWSMNADPLLHEMTYKDKELIIHKEGYYYVYSKVFFSDNGIFRHYISLHTNKYHGNITLLQSRKYSLHSNKKQESNSYLGGVFHLYKDDGIFVQVSDTTKVVRHKPFENIFGAYMI